MPSYTTTPCQATPPHHAKLHHHTLPSYTPHLAKLHHRSTQVSRKDCWGCRLGRRLFRLVDQSPVSPLFQHPVVIVGSGLSAADAVLYALERNIPVVHVFEKSVEEVAVSYRSLSALLYPDYCRVFDLMSQKTLMPGFYQSMPGVQVLAFLDDKKVVFGGCGGWVFY